MKYALEIIGKLQAENKLLKDEVENLRKHAENSPPQSPLEAKVNYFRIEAVGNHARWLRTLEENESLRAEVKRLTKAGDAMAEIVKSFGFDQAPISWNKAKEGKSKP